MAWKKVGNGIHYRCANDGAAALVAYGGYSAKLAYAKAWADALVEARLAAAGVGHVYAVQGPRTAGYVDKEIENAKLRRHLGARDGAAPIYIVAHSSGAHVAEELLVQLGLAQKWDILGRIAYAALDGNGGGLTRNLVDSLAAIAFVKARDPDAGVSMNAGAMDIVAKSFGRKAVEVVARDTGCTSGWCLHDVLVTRSPHDPEGYDLQHDYGRDVMTDYFDALIAKPTPKKKPAGKRASPRARPRSRPRPRGTSGT